MTSKLIIGLDGGSEMPLDVVGSWQGLPSELRPWGSGHRDPRHRHRTFSPTMVRKGRIRGIVSVGIAKYRRDDPQCLSHSQRDLRSGSRYRRKRVCASTPFALATPARLGEYGQR